MGHVINITQSIKQTGNASYTVKMTVNDGDIIEAIEFNFDKTNGIYPLYKSLMQVLERYRDVHVNLITCDERFAKEVNGMATTNNTTLIKLLKQITERWNITINASVNKK